MLSIPSRSVRDVLVAAIVLLAASQTFSLAAADVPSIRPGNLGTTILIDGKLDEPDWRAATPSEPLRQVDPQEGAVASAPTRLRVLAGPKALIFGLECEQPTGTNIVSYSVRRDAVLNSEDHVRIVLDPFLDGRSGYVFAINPSGARYDGLVNPGGETENPDWDGIWEAATQRTASGWTAEIRIPIHTLSFKPGLHAWYLNVQRRIQGRLEVDRWASAARQYTVTQTSRAGLLTDLPEFDLGIGLAVRPSITAGAGVPALDQPSAGELQPSLDVTKRVGANVLASLTVNTDFAETEVDTHQPHAIPAVLS